MGEVEGFADLNKVAREVIGCTPTALRRRLRAAGLDLYRHPADNRRRLLRTEDVERLSRPVPLRERGTPMPAA